MSPFFQKQSFTFKALVNKDDYIVSITDELKEMSNTTHPQTRWHSRASNSVWYSGIVVTLLNPSCVAGTTINHSS